MGSLKKIPRVLIIGAGLGGLTLAQCLRKKGIPYQIFDRDEDITQRSGWAIGIHSILESLKPAFCSDMPPLATADHLSPLNLEPQIVFYRGESRIAVQNSPETPCMRLNRFKFREWLATKIPVQWGKKIVRVEEEKDQVTVHFGDGTSASGEILIGADGLNSVVREHVLGRPNRDVLNLNPLAIIWGETTLSGAAMERQLSLGHSAYALAPAGNRIFVGLNKVNEDLSGDYYWYFSYEDDKVGDEDHWLMTATKEAKYEYVRKVTDTLEPKFREIFERTSADHITPGPWLSRDAVIPSFPVKRTVLLGDAAHAMTPFRGEGGMHALRDAMSLSDVFDDIDWIYSQEKLDAYQSEALERGSKAVVLSRNAWAAGANPNFKPMAWGHEATPSPVEKVLLVAYRS
ncbi:FAD/NAD(P)-binding domain-containing protein [Xylariaceae sp. FL0255]|nr:FAD/NAD(P)-binding domain-containing protein [Xylariaceae sp. FL0255]